MTTVYSVVNLVLVLLGAVSFVWSIIGVPAGLYFVFRYLTTKDSVYKERLPKKIFISFLGLILFILTPILWSLFKVIGLTTGGSVLHSGNGGIAPPPSN